jgi:hypothetical protein
VSRLLPGLQGLQIFMGKCILPYTWPKHRLMAVCSWSSDDKTEEPVGAEWSDVDWGSYGEPYDMHFSICAVLDFAIASAYRPCRLDL